jgi:two-component system chemotaxis sensor kinase CheA
MSEAMFNDPEMQEIFEGFLVETQELIDSLSQDLMLMEDNPDDMELLNRIFRSFHTIKGTSSFMGFDSIAHITHHAEDLLNKLRREELKANQAITDVLLEVQDWIQFLMNQLQQGINDKVDYQNTIDELERLSAGGGSAPKADKGETGKDANKSDIPKDNALNSVLTNPEIVQGPGDFSDDELELIQAAFAEVNSNFFEDGEITHENSPAEETNHVEESVSEEVKATETKDTPSIPKAPEAPAKEVAKKPATSGAKVNTETIRIDISRVEELMDLSGELVLGRNRLAQITEIMEQEFEHTEHIRDLIETTAAVDFVTSEIQAAVMRMRMVPVGKLYQKAPRIVRDLSKEFGKQIKLIVKGEETEIDRGIIEELNDPLVHMIRNSCDHGIEDPETRSKLGKPPYGTVTLDAEQEGNNIVLKISDDGRGMDPNKLKAKALEKGVITQEQAATMTDRETFQLIFMPGFSTAQKVSSVSGRGVGMDVVRTNIQNLKGMIDIESVLDKGSTFIIKLPLTLAIIQGLLVKVQNETYALPLSSVVEVVAIEKSAVKSVNKQEVIRIRQEVLPIVRMDKTLKTKEITKELDGRYVVNVGLGMKRIGLVVDELLGQQEIVIKSLGEYLGNIKGIAGSTILGDGSVIMIIDVTELVESLYTNNEFVQYAK